MLLDNISGFLRDIGAKVKYHSAARGVGKLFSLRDSPADFLINMVSMLDNPMVRKDL